LQPRLSANRELSVSAFIRSGAVWLLALTLPATVKADDGTERCAAELSQEEQHYLEACVARGRQCTDFWPGYPEDLNDCVRVQKWLSKAITMPPSMREEMFGAVRGPAAAASPVHTAAPVHSTPAWKHLPRSQDSAGPREVAGSVSGATATDYSGASSNIDPAGAKAAGLGFWTGQIVQLADTVEVANREPTVTPRSMSAPAQVPPMSPPTPHGGDNSGAVSPKASSADHDSHNYDEPSTRVSVTPQRLPYKPNANACVGLSGNQLVNNCSKAIWIAFCTLNPRQTQNFFDSSDAFKCPKGGLESISGNGRNGLVWHGWVQFFACYADDIGTMKTSFYGVEPRAAAPGTLQGSYTGAYHGFCAGSGDHGFQDGGGSVYAK
jgi:hypothetical protein